MTTKSRIATAVTTAVTVLAATATAGAAVIPPDKITVAGKAMPVLTQQCAPKPGVPAYNITATNMDCRTALDIALRWSEMTRGEKCPRHLCQFSGVTCRSGSEIHLSPRVTCTAGSRRVSFTTPTELTLAD